MIHDYPPAADLPACSLLRDVCLWSPRLAQAFGNVLLTKRELTKAEKAAYDHEQYRLRRERKLHHEMH